MAINFSIRDIQHIDPHFAELINEYTQIELSDNEDVFGMYRLPEPAVLGKNFIFFAGSGDDRLLRNSLIYVYIYDDIGRRIPVTTGELSITGEYYVSYDVEELGGKMYVYVFGTRADGEKVYMVSEIVVDVTLPHYEDVYQGVSAIQYGDTIDLSWLYKEENVPDPSMFLTEIIVTDLAATSDIWYWLGITGRNFFEKNFAQVGDLGFKIRPIRNEKAPYAGVMQNLITTKNLTEYAIDYTNEYSLISQSSEGLAWSSISGTTEGVFLPQVAQKSIIAGVTFENRDKKLSIKEYLPNYFSGSLKQFEFDTFKISDAYLEISNTESELLKFYRNYSPTEIYQLYKTSDCFVNVFKNASVEYVRSASMDGLLPAKNYYNLDYKSENFNIETDFMSTNYDTIGAPDYPWQSFYVDKILVGDVSLWADLFMYLTFSSSADNISALNDEFSYRHHDETIYDNYGFCNSDILEESLKFTYGITDDSKLMLLNRNKFNDGDFTLEMGMSASWSIQSATNPNLL